MRKLALILALLGSYVATFAQSETSNYITYDSTIAVTNASTSQGGTYPYPWRIRVTRPSDYFQKIANDSTQRRRIFLFMPGAGEVPNGNLSHDTALTSLWGFHYFQKYGLFDGSLKIGNGTHYPIYITVIQPSPTGNTRPWFVLGLLRSLKATFQPRGNRFDVFGFSQGSYEWGTALWYSNNVAGDHETMSLIESWTDLEGVGPESFQSGIDLTFPQVWSTYVNAPYNGHFFALEGVNDSRNIYTQLASPMNTGKAGSAYFSYQNIADSTGTAGSHCCWNSMYNPATKNWQCVAPITNTNLVSNSQNSMGTYFVDPVNGTNIFQWALRQGDTTLVTGTAPTTYVTNPVDKFFSMGEYVTGAIFTGKVYSMTGNANLAGNGGVGIPATIVAANMPSNLKFSLIAPILHGCCALDTTGGVYCYGGNGMGTVMNGTLTDPVLTPTKVARDSAGNPMTICSYIKGTYSGNNAEGCYIVKHGLLSDTLYMGGLTTNGLRGDGYTGDTAVYPVQVWKLPSGKRIVQIASEKYSAARLNDGTIWTCGGGGFGNVNYAYLGYAPTNSATDYLTWRQVLMPNFNGSPDSAVEVVGGDVGGTIVRGKSGKLYGWGPNSDYLGNAAGGAFAVPTDLATYITNSIPGGVRQLAANSFCFHAISNSGVLYGWGDNAMGGVGNGDQINLSNLTDPYFVDPAAAHQYMVVKPVQITSRTDYTAVYADCLFGFGTIAVTINGVMIYMGRNKGSIAGDGVKEPNANVTQFMPDSYDRKWGTEIKPLNLTASITTYPPYCVFNPSYQYCSGITRPTTTPHANAGANQNITGTTATLDGSASTSTGGTLITYHWYLVNGPGAALVDINDRVQPVITNMNTPGVYTFRLVVTDNAQRQDSTTMTVTATAGNVPPTVSAGPNVRVTVGTTSVNLTGTATGNAGATITSVLWTVVSGPNTPTLTNANTNTVTVSNLVKGVYTMQFSATDSNNQTSSATMTLTVGSNSLLQFTLPTSIK